MKNYKKMLFRLYACMIITLLYIGVFCVGLTLGEVYASTRYSKLFGILVSFLLSRLVVFILVTLSDNLNRYYSREFNDVFSHVTNEDNMVDEYAIESKFKRNKYVSFNKDDKQKYINYINTYKLIAIIIGILVNILYGIFFMFELILG